MSKSRDEEITTAALEVFKDTGRRCAFFAGARWADEFSVESIECTYQSHKKLEDELVDYKDVLKVIVGHGCAEDAIVANRILVKWEKK